MFMNIGLTEEIYQIRVYWINSIVLIIQNKINIYVIKRMYSKNDLTTVGYFWKIKDFLLMKEVSIYNFNN